MSYFLKLRFYWNQNINTVFELIQMTTIDVQARSFVLKKLQEFR